MPKFNPVPVIRRVTAKDPRLARRCKSSTGMRLPTSPIYMGKHPHIEDFQMSADRWIGNLSLR